MKHLLLLLFLFAFAALCIAGFAIVTPSHAPITHPIHR